MANNNYPQITSVTSEALQAQIRTLLPSQEGFGTDLMAQNVIVPIIDLTSAAEGSNVPEFLQRSLAFGSQNSFSANNSTATIANTAGFWQIDCGYGVYINNVLAATVDIDISDGLATKELYSFSSIQSFNGTGVSVNSLSFVVFLRSGDSLTTTCSQFAECAGSARQIADVNGTLINPSGFNPQ